MYMEIKNIVGAFDYIDQHQLFFDIASGRLTLDKDIIELFDAVSDKINFSIIPFNTKIWTLPVLEKYGDKVNWKKAALSRIISEYVFDKYYFKVSAATKMYLKYNMFIDIWEHIDLKLQDADKTLRKFIITNAACNDNVPEWFVLKHKKYIDFNLLAIENANSFTDNILDAIVTKLSLDSKNSIATCAKKLSLKCVKKHMPEYMVNKYICRNSDKFSVKTVKTAIKTLSLRINDNVSINRPNYRRLIINDIKCAISDLSRRSEKISVSDKYLKDIERNMTDLFEFREFISTMSRYNILSDNQSIRYADFIVSYIMLPYNYRYDVLKRMLSKIDSNKAASVVVSLVYNLPRKNTAKYINNYNNSFKYYYQGCNHIADNDAFKFYADKSGQYGQLGMLSFDEVYKLIDYVMYDLNIDLVKAYSLKGTFAKSSYFYRRYISETVKE